MFHVLEGEIEATFRGEKSVVRAGETLNIPANAPHSFTNASERPARLLCMCTPAGQEEFFMKVGVLVEGRTTLPPEPSEDEHAAFLARRYRNEFGILEIPAPVQRFAFPVLVAIGKLLGRYDKYADAPEPVRR